MGRRSRHGRIARAALTWALLEVALGTIGLVVKSDREPPRPAATPLQPTTTAPPAPSSSVVVVTGTSLPPAPAAPPAAAAAGTGATETVTPDAPSTEPEATPTTSPPSGHVTAQAVSVACHPDLQLGASPDLPYSFLCTAGDTPISWPSDSIRLFSADLTPAQTAALPIALAQWEADGRFTVTRVSSASAANVVMTGAALGNNEDGYTSMHYVCAATCAYDHADVQFDTAAELTKTSWISTILHELGHVAGLNHVARHSEVMYPQIDARSPAVYGSGDLAGLQALEKVRPAA